MEVNKTKSLNGGGGWVTWHHAQLFCPLQTDLWQTILYMLIIYDELTELILPIGRVIDPTQLLARVETTL